MLVLFVELEYLKNPRTGVFEQIARFGFAHAAGPGFDPDVYYPKAYEVFSADGKQFGVPEQFSDVLLFYNKDLFDAAGVNYPDASWTWEDERAADSCNGPEDAT